MALECHPHCCLEFLVALQEGQRHRPWGGEERMGGGGHLGKKPWGQLLLGQGRWKKKAKTREWAAVAAAAAAAAGAAAAGALEAGGRWRGYRQPPRLPRQQEESTASTLPSPMPPP